MKAGRVVMIVIGALLALIGFGLVVGGATALVGYGTQRTDGYFQTGDVRVASRDLRDHVGPRRPRERPG